MDKKEKIALVMYDFEHAHRMQQVYKDVVKIEEKLGFPYYTGHSKKQKIRLDKVNNILEHSYGKMIIDREK